MEKNKDILVRISNLRTYFPVKKGVFRRTVGQVKAVDGVDLEIIRGETLGVVGESGCGKTTLGKSIIQLCKPTSGKVLYAFPDGEKDLAAMNDKALDVARKRLQIVFQDPYSSLNPAFTIFGSFSDPLKKFGIKSRTDREAAVGRLLEAVNLPKDYMTRYPNEFSGGQRQRIGIARALSVDPELIVCDEAVSALDVSIRAQVLKLFKELQAERGLTYLFITHDLSVVEYISDRIAVMYLGKVVELAETQELFRNTVHPYTKALLSAIPIADLAQKKKRIPLQGDVPSPVNPPAGCPFHPRCTYCQPICRTEVPKLTAYPTGGTAEHHVACHFALDFLGGTR
ncbi:MAG: peptide ABC transporter ATP-binding protein [Spirochaetae bacterium HGW-Spirochaetae-7]|nr:MAG: peptide ABC transporter ATP-binding protein [Spirochaetae bacterium HGW-Spirochaetae-7]